MFSTVRLTLQISFLQRYRSSHSHFSKPLCISIIGVGISLRISQVALEFSEESSA
jgi:hypothetical protein